MRALRTDPIDLTPAPLSPTSYLFVTGMPRSGTTLLDKLLSAHPRAHVLSQPLPLLYVRVKQEYQHARGVRGNAAGTAYPLNDMFGDHYYPAQDFVEFLRRYRLGGPFCRQTLKQMVPFSGHAPNQLTPLPS